MGIEQSLGSALLQSYQDKSYIDKVTSKEEVAEVKELMSHPILSREDLDKLMCLLVGNELKLVNFGDYGRYLSGKFFAWVSDIIGANAIFFDYADAIKDKKISATPEDEILIQNIHRIFSHANKTLINTFFFIDRSSVGLGGVGFETLSKNRNEINYSGNVSTVSDTSPQVLRR